MKKDLYQYPVDSILTSDEWDHVRYLISENLKRCETEDKLHIDDLPFIFTEEIERKLLKAGFKKETLDDPEQFNELLYIIDGHA